MNVYRQLFFGSVCVFGLIHCGSDDDLQLDDSTLQNIAADAIVNGDDPSADLPGRIGILVGQPPRGRGFRSCGVSFIGKSPESNDYWMLTAAHCVDDPTFRYFVGFGGSDFSEFDEFFSVDEVVVHPNFSSNSANTLSDIALLSVSVKPPKAIRSRLATRETDAAVEECLIIGGFGQADPGDAGSALVLRQGESRRISARTCNRRLAGPELRPSQLCLLDRPAGSEISDDTLQGSCRGDSGSPSYRQNFVQVGIASRAPSGCMSAFPEIHTRVSAFRRWIEQVTGGI